MLIDGIDASYVDLADPTYLDFGYVRRIGDVIDVAWPEGQPIAAVHLGGAGATLPRYIRATRPRSRQVVFEISADVLTLAREHLGLRSGGGLRVHQQDARLGLLGIADASQDLVVGDAFEAPGCPTRSAAPKRPSRSPACCDPGGLYVLNVIDSPPLGVRAGAGAARCGWRSPSWRRSPTRGCCAAGGPATSFSSPASRSCRLRRWGSARGRPRCRNASWTPPHACVLPAARGPLRDDSAGRPEDGDPRIRLISGRTRDRSAAGSGAAPGRARTLRRGALQRRRRDDRADVAVRSLVEVDDHGRVIARILALAGGAVGEGRLQP